MIGSLHLTLILIQEKNLHHFYEYSISISIAVSPIFLTYNIWAIFQ